ncbi:mitochondrial enolase superfamily member 1 [Grus japonensis]|uniref:Mitochondrial enolase superfamily member 1 n=1 Tax=Grus japonensis TaxID=30415 RepID=A0ABC9W415_GRUJA
MVSDLLHHLDTHKSMELDGIHPRALRELAEVLTKPFSIIYQQSWLNREVPVDWKLANVTPNYKKGCEENLREVQACQSDVSAGEGYGADHLECHHVACTGQPGDQAQSAWVHERSCLTNLISFYDKVTHLVDERKAVDVVYLDFSKTFDTVSHSILLEELAAYSLDRCTLHWCVGFGWDKVNFLHSS